MRLLTVLLLSSFYLIRFHGDENKLSNTKWEGTFHAPSPVDGVLEFKTDSMYLWIDDNIVESMTFKASGDTLVITKLDGNSPCDTSSGYYHYKIENDVLTVSVINDNCMDRVNAFEPDGYKKVQ